jgi:hypothetical protein
MDEENTGATVVVVGVPVDVDAVVAEEAAEVLERHILVLECNGSTRTRHKPTSLRGFHQRLIAQDTEEEKIKDYTRLLWTALYTLHLGGFAPVVT